MRKSKSSKKKDTDAFISKSATSPLSQRTNGGRSFAGNDADDRQKKIDLIFHNVGIRVPDADLDSVCEIPPLPAPPFRFRLPTDDETDDEWRSNVYKEFEIVLHKYMEDSVEYWRREISKRLNIS